MNMIKEVKDMNIAFGNSEGVLSDFEEGAQHALFDTERDNRWDMLRTQAKCIPEEVEELLYAIDNYDITEVRDAVCDIMVFTIGLAHKAGIDLSKDMHSVFVSNMTKFCTDDVALQATIEKYTNIGIDVEERGEFPRAFVASIYDQNDNFGKFYPKNKFLKSVSYEAPVFL